MSYLMTARPGSYSRLCDVCGKGRPIESMRTVDGLFICDFHPGYIPQRVLDKVPWVSIGPKPIPGNVKPYKPVDTWESQEAETFKLVRFAPYSQFVASAAIGVPSGVETIASAAWSCLYLYGLISENKRPLAWMSSARAKLIAVADWIMSQQIGGHLVSNFASSELQWGAFLVDGNYSTVDSAAAGLALLRAYQLTSKSEYLTTARATAWFTRTMQCGDLVTTTPSSSNAAGTAHAHFGAWTSNAKMSNGLVVFDHQYSPDSLLCAEFLTLFKAIAGDETIGSSTVTGDFTASRAALVSTSIAEGVNFWKNGTWDSVTGTVITGLSSTTPRQIFNSYPTTKTGYSNGNGAWNFLTTSDAATGTTIPSYPICTGIRSLYAIEGASALVTGLFDWLMTFTSNPAYELPADYDDHVLWSGQLGTYDPTFAPAQMLQVRTPTTLTTSAINGGSLYDLSSLGHLAPLYSSRQAAGFKSAKEVLGLKRPWRKDGSDRDGQYQWINLCGTIGLSYQPTSPLNTYAAAQLGNIYRYAPQAFLAQGHSVPAPAESVPVVTSDEITFLGIDGGAGSGGGYVSTTSGSTEPGNLVLLYIVHRRGTVLTVTGSLPWALVSTIGNGSGSATNIVTYLYSAISADGAVDVTVSYDPGLTIPNAEVILFHYFPVSTVIQSQSVYQASGTTVTITLGSFIKKQNAAVGFITKTTGTSALQPGAGFSTAVILPVVSGINVNTEIQSQADKTVDWSWATAAPTLGIAVEIGSLT